MRGHGDHLSVGDRIAFYRRRRGLTQRALGELVGRTDEWLRKVEAGRHEIDRLSVLREVARVLAVSVSDLIGAHIILEWTDTEQHASIPALRAALTDYQQYLPVPSSAASPRAFDLDAHADRVANAWEDYQACRYNRVALLLPKLVTDTATAARHLVSDDQRRAQRQAASVHQLCGVFLPKLGESDLALIAAGKGLELAQICGDTAILASLYRIVAYCLAANGEYEQALALAESAISTLAPELSRSDASDLDISVYGMLHLVASRAAAQANDRGQADQHLRHADRIATWMGYDGNHGWTGFGPINVTIHRTAAAVELGDLLRAAEIGPRLDTSALPTERRGRHAIESARALAGIGRISDAIGLLLDAELYAPEQIRHHSAAREIARRAIRHRVPEDAAAALATRMNLQAL